ncbi:MAG: nuclear transport factor 2 family protein [bacterium]|nr:nuclear transport factor 2 family protein [bacterium]
MRRIVWIIAMGGILWTGGVAVAGDPLTDLYPEEQAAVKQRVHEVWQACRDNDVEQLAAHHLDSGKFSKWVDGAADIIGYTETVAYETEFWSQAKDFVYEIENLRVDVFGATAVAAFVIPYEAAFGGETLKGKERATFVFVKQEGDWKIVHEHFSPVTVEP